MMESEIVIHVRHLEVCYVGLENMGNGRKRVERVRDFHSSIRENHCYFLKEKTYTVDSRYLEVEGTL